MCWWIKLWWSWTSTSLVALVQLDVDNERCKSTANRLLVARSALAYVSHVLAVPVLDFRCRVTSSDWELYGKQRSKCNVFHLVVGLLLWCFQSLCSRCSFRCCSYRQYFQSHSDTLLSFITVAITNIVVLWHIVVFYLTAREVVLSLFRRRPLLLTGLPPRTLRLFFFLFNAYFLFGSVR